MQISAEELNNPTWKDSTLLPPQWGKRGCLHCNLKSDSLKLCPPVSILYISSRHIEMPILALDVPNNVAVVNSHNCI